MLSHPNIISYCELYIPYIDICIYVSNVCHLNLPRISKYHILIINIYTYTYIHVYIYVSSSFHSTAEGAFTRWLAGIDVPNTYIYIYIYSINIIYPIKKKKNNIIPYIYTYVYHISLIHISLIHISSYVYIYTYHISYISHIYNICIYIYMYPICMSHISSLNVCVPFPSGIPFDDDTI